jgi:serine/threonine protein phosphatase PrpC
MQKALTLDVFALKEGDHIKKTVLSQIIHLFNVNHFDKLSCSFLTSISGTVANNKQVCFFGIFDGHGGHLVSEYLAESFFSKLFSHKRIEFQPLLALQEVWQSFDENCYSECLRVLKANNLSTLPVAGSTATICFISNNDVFILNCGDSAAYFVMQDGTSAMCTEDHGTLNTSEVERCKKAGGYLKNQTIMTNGSFPRCCSMEEVIVGKARIYPGGLLVTR